MSTLVGSPEDRFSHNVALINLSLKVWTFHPPYEKTGFLYTTVQAGLCQPWSETHRTGFLINLSLKVWTFHPPYLNKYLIPFVEFSIFGLRPYSSL